MSSSMLETTPSGPVEGFGLSPQQGRLWTLQPGTEAPFVARARFLLEGAVTPAEVERALGALERRFEVLRTRFATPPGMRLPLMVIGEPGEASRPPVLSRQVRTQGNGLELEVSLPALLADRVGLLNLARELALELSALRSGQPRQDETLQLADLAQWQNDILAEHKQRLPGREKVAEAAVEGTLPSLLFGAPAGSAFGPESQPVPLSETTARRLVELFGGTSGAARAWLAAAWTSVLARWSDGASPVLGVSFEGRNYAELQHAVGPFEKFLPVVLEATPRMSFRLACERAAQVLAELENWQEAFGWESSVGLVELRYRALLDVFPAGLPSFAAGPDLTVRVVQASSSCEPFELRLSAAIGSDRLELELAWDRDRFERARVERLAAGLAVWLEAAVADPEAELGRLPLVGPREAELLVSSWSGRAERQRDRVPLVPEAFAAQVAAVPSAAAVVAAGESWSYAELDGAAGCLAAGLAALGVGLEDRVALHAERTPWLLAAVLGCWQRGAAVVPLDLGQPAERLRSLVATSRARVLLADSDEGAALAGLGTTVLRLDAADRVLPAAQPGGSAPVLGESLAYVIFTSGSTGPPKAVGVEHRQLAAYVAAVRARLGLPDGASYASVSTIAADLGHTAIFPALVSGGCLHLVPRDVSTDPNRYRDYAEAAGIDLLKIVPGHLQALLHASERPAAVLPRRVLVCGGEASRWPELERVRALAPRLRILNHYGPTEATVGALTHEPALVGNVDGAQRPPSRPVTVPLGRPLEDAEVYVLDLYGHLAPVGVAGELFLGGDGIARGYLERPAATAERFVPHPLGSAGERLYRTGDRVRFLADGSLEFLGRVDHQVKIRGYRVELGEVAAALGTHPAVEVAHVVAPEREGARHLVAYVGVGSSNVEAAELEAHLASVLPPAAVPGTYVVLPSLPRTANGKVDAKALPPPEAVQKAGSRRAPSTATERALAALWSELLRVESLGAEQSFFDLGGHSLLAMRLVAEVAARFGVEVPLRHFVATPTVAAVAVLIDRARAAGQTDLGGPTLPQAIADPDRRHQPFPLTEVQQAYWVGRSRAFELGNVATHTYLEYDVDGLDFERFERALRQVIDRHEMLRAVVLPNGEQVILPEVPAYRVALQDLRAKPAERVEAALEAWRREMSHQQLAADRWPLFEVRASRLPAGEAEPARFRLHVSSDAIVRDAWSFRLISRDLLAAYADPGTRLEPLEVSFRDYVLGEVAFTESAVYRQSLAYWQARLDSLPSAPQLPLAVNPASIAEPRFTLRTATLPRSSWERLKQRGAQIGLSPTGLVLAVFAEALAQWSKSPHFLVNLTVFNRFPVHPQINEVVGDFTSLLLYEVDARGGGSFEARARRVQERLWEDLDHRHVSGVRVLRDLARRAGTAGRAVAPVVLTSVLGFEEGAAATLAELAIPARLVFSANQTPQVWLDHQAMEDGGALLYNWAVVEELFPAGLLDDLFAAYGSLLARLASEQEAWSQAVPALLPREQAARRAAANATAAPEPQALLHELFLEQARRGPERVAIETPERRLTYGELERVSRAVALRLRTLGVRPNELVAVVMEKGWEQVAGVLAILRAGGAYLPIDAELPPERQHALLQRGRCRVALTQRGSEGRLEWPVGLERFVVEAHLLSPEDLGELTEPAQGSADLAYVIFTSGSTGQPKGVMIDHRGAVNTVVDVNERFAITDQDAVLGLSSLSFDLSVYDVFGVLGAGGTLVLPAPAMARDPGAWCRLVLGQEVTVWNSVPALCELLVEYLEEHPELGASETGGSRIPLRLVLLSGDWIPVSLPERLRKLAPDAQLISLGGATEASIWSILYPIADVDPGWRSIPYGKAMANQTFHVLDENLRSRPDWVPGELYIGGIGVALGYYGEPERTEAVFSTDPMTAERRYRTGDLGRWLPDGDIEFLGREDLQVKVQGHRIELGEIEAALAALPGVASAAAMATPRELGPRRLVGYVVARSGEPVEASALREALRAKLPAYMVPATVVILDALPLSGNGKVDRAALPLPEAVSSPAPAQPLSAATSALVARVAVLVAGVLKVPTVDPSLSLLEQGATSIDVVRVANKLEDELGQRPPMNELFQSPLAELVERHFERLAEPSQEEGGPSEASSSGHPRWLARRPLRDPAEREAFKERQPGLRRDVQGSRLALSRATSDEAELFLARRSHRTFAPQPVPLAALGGLLGALRQVSLDAETKYRYGSAGGLYPVQTYVLVKAGRVEGLAGGVYYHDPVGHELIPLADHEPITAEHYGWLSQSVFAAGSFALYLVAQARAIVELYEGKARDFCLIEAGLMAQLLETEAPVHGLGLCQIGGLDFDRVRPSFALDDDHELMHSLVGGPLDLEAEGRKRAGAELDDWQEGSL
jgi:amino acid adenylation domain-containing protein